MSADPAVSGAPFVGLRPFDIGDAAWFFGRDQEAAALTRKLRAARFTAVVGPSGSGKSSVVRAGVIPLMRELGWQQIIAKPGSAPLSRLADAFAASVDERRLADARRFRFDAMLRASAFGLAEIVDTLETNAPRLLLVVDQFEELFRYGEEAAGAARAGMREEARAFVELLLAATETPRGPLHVCVTMRSDYFGNCAAYTGLSEAVSTSQFLVSLPLRAQLEEAIRKPVEKAGGRIEEALVQRLLVDIEEQTDQLPLLQHTLRRLWEHASGIPPTLRGKDYVAVGRIVGSIDHKAEAVLAALEKANQSDRVILERVMKALTDLDERDRATRRPQKRSELIALVRDIKPFDASSAGAALDRVLGLLKAEDTSFVQLGQGEDSEVDIGHEALILGWTRLAGPARDFKAGWLREEREDGERWRGYLRRVGQRSHLRIKEQLSLRRWLQSRSIGEAWSQRYGNRWKEVKDFRNTSGGYNLIFGIMGFSIICIALYLVSNFAQQAAASYRQAHARELAYAAENALESDPELGSLLAIAAVHVTHSADNSVTAEAAAALQDALRTPRPENRLLGLAGAPLTMFFSTDGTRLVATSQAPATAILDAATRLRVPAWRPKIMIWDTASSLPVPNKVVDEQPVSALAVSPDGQRVARAGSDGVVTVSDRASGNQLFTVVHSQNSLVTTSFFSPDGRRLATRSVDGSAKVSDVNSGTELFTLEGNDKITILTYSPGAKWLAIATQDKRITVLDADTGTVAFKSEPGQSVITALTFSTDGKRLAARSFARPDGGNVTLWDVQSGYSSPLSGYYNAVAFSPEETFSRARAKMGSSTFGMLAPLAMSNRQACCVLASLQF
jgi:hypothetical protein